MANKIIITGCIGFIGFHLCKNLLKKNNIKILGIDNINQYYPIKLKKNRLKILKETSKNNNNFIFKKESISNKNKMFKIFKLFQPDIVINLAAQAGVRHSLKYPEKYLRDNIKGFLNILELSKLYNVKKLYTLLQVLFMEEMTVHFKRIPTLISKYNFTQLLKKLMN